MVVVISSKSLCILSSIVPHKTSSGACSSLPMGVAPESIVERLISSIGSKTICFLTCHEIITLLNKIVGCALSAPDGSSPRGYSRIFLGVDSKNDFFFIGLNFSSTSLICPYTNSPCRTIFGMFIFPVSSATIVFIPGYSHICDVINIIRLFAIIS
jgi:hypothetical protein